MQIAVDYFSMLLIVFSIYEVMSMQFFSHIFSDVVKDAISLYALSDLNSCFTTFSFADSNVLQFVFVSIIGVAHI